MDRNKLSQYIAKKVTHTNKDVSVFVLRPRHLSIFELGILRKSEEHILELINKESGD